MIDQGLKLTSLLLILALNGCAITSVNDDTGAQKLPRNSIGWSFQGKAAVTQANAKTNTVNLDWSRLEATRDQLRLSGPLGSGALELWREDEQLFWLDGGLQKPLETLPVDDEVVATLTTLPLNLISAWLMGYHDSTDGWQVKITQWQVAGGWQLPRKIEAYRDDLSVRLVVLKWNLEALQQ